MSGASGGVVLGPVTLQGYEVPEQVTFGGSQRLAVHRLPGGGRVVDAMGADDRNLTWSGMMLGPDAAARARALDALRVAGTAVPLVFGDTACDVVVAAFEAEYRRASWIGGYRIACLVLPATPAAPSSLTGDLADDLGSALAIDPDGALGLAATVGTAQVALAAAGTLVGGAAGTVALGAALGQAQAVVGGAQAGAEAAMAGLIAAGSPDLDGAVAAGGVAEILAKGSAAAGLLGRAAANRAVGAG